jgi:hypothetical protein
MGLFTSPWSVDQANAWYSELPWLCGFNYLPSSAVNFIEFWQGATFDEPTIRRELELAASVGFNTCRVNLMFEVHVAERESLQRNFETFLSIAAQHGILTMVCFFDDCSSSGSPVAGPQGEPLPGLHNSRQVGSPAADIVRDPLRWVALEEYVRSYVVRYADDPRVLCWDLYNEAGQCGLEGASLPLLEAAFTWARQSRPTQPLTSGIWQTGLAELTRRTLELSDILTFHSYGPTEKLERFLTLLEPFGRPILCTEFLARTLGSRLETHVPYFKSRRIGCYSWGLVNGRTQTHLPWSHLPAPEVPEWFHDLFNADGTPYSETEIALLRDSLITSPATTGSSA